jgi:hypothetical protein
MLAAMNRRPLLAALVLIGIATAISRAVVTHHGVGAIEYVTSIALVGLLLLGALGLARRAIRRA